MIQGAQYGRLVGIPCCEHQLCARLAEWRAVTVTAHVRARVAGAQGGNEEALPVLERELAVIKGLAPTESPPPPSAPSALLQQVARLRVLPAPQLDYACGVLYACFCARRAVLSLLSLL